MNLVVSEQLLVSLTLGSSLIALLFALLTSLWVVKQNPGNELMQKISKNIRIGAKAFLKRQYTGIVIFFAVVGALLGVMAYFNYVSVFVPFAFLSGGFFSGLSGYIGMTVATLANCRTTQGASESLNKGLRVAFSAGAVMGMTVVGLGLLDLSIWFSLLRFVFHKEIPETVATMLTFGMGASSMALFARVGGGIFTKAADVGADVVGKVEKNIPEDDARNPAVVADNVGDNVGDVAGMGADLYESYVGSIVATSALGVAAFAASGQALEAVVIPMAVAAVGVIASIIGTFFVRAKENATQQVLLGALRKGVYSSSLLILIGAYYLVQWVMPANMGIYWAIVSGLIAGNIIGYATEYYTSDHYKPTKQVAASAVTGPATVIISGIGIAMTSTFVSVFVTCAAILAAYYLAGGYTNVLHGVYGVGISAVGMLATLGITLATDAYGPVADNAGGIAEQAHLKPIVRKRTDALDMLGNTTAATGKGFAIASAALTALALITAYRDEIAAASTKLGLAFTFDLSLSNINVLIGIFVGAVLPFIFCGTTMMAVGRAASKIVDEVRRQFKKIKGIMKGTAEPDYAACVDIATAAAQKEMVFPALLAIISPIATGLLLGPNGVVAMLTSSLATGFVLAIFMANAGGSWDNAKKHIEGGKFGGKGSDAHKAAVVGDTVGDPFKDTSGPSLNILLKLMSMVSIVFAGLVVANYIKF
jgi:K(+)-stimulated pyrophosphate-energized sodium pump